MNKIFAHIHKVLVMFYRLVCLRKHNTLLRHGGRDVGMGVSEQKSSPFLSKLLELVEMFMVLLSHISIKGLVVTSMLLLLVLLSAIGVVYSSHLSRQLFTEQAILLERNDHIQLEWAQLLLEQSAWSSPNRIEGVASEKLGMEIPKAEHIQLIY